jgi:AraC-like DNA-binding protein
MHRVHDTEQIAGHTFTAARLTGVVDVRADERGVSEQERCLPLSIHSSGVSRWAEGDTHEWTSTLLSMNLITAGEAQYEQEGRSGRACAGDVVLMHKGCRHAFRTGPCGLMHHRFVRLEGATCDSILRSAGLLDIDIVRPRSPARVRLLMRESHRLLSRKPRDYYLELSRIAYALVVECAQIRPRDEPGPLSRAVAFVNSNTFRPVTLEEIARSALVSTRTCSRLFLARFGQSPVAYALARRLAVAAEMLAGTTMSAKEIGVAVGFRDPSHFALAYRRRYGASPNRYRSLTCWPGRSRTATDPSS